MGRIVYVGRMGHIVHIRIYGLYDVDEINGTPSVYGSYHVYWDIWVI